MTLLASLRDWLKAQQLDAVLLSSRIEPDNCYFTVIRK